MAALKYLETQCSDQPKLAELYNSLLYLYKKNLWHQLTLKLEQFVAFAVLRLVIISYLYHNFIGHFETKINLLKLAHFAVIVSCQYTENGATIAYLEEVIEKLRATREMRIEEPIFYVMTQIAAFKLEEGNQKKCKKLLDEGKGTLDSMTDADPSVYASCHWISCPQSTP